MSLNSSWGNVVNFVVQVLLSSNLLLSLTFDPTTTAAISPKINREYRKPFSTFNENVSNPGAKISFLFMWKFSLVVIVKWSHCNSKKVKTEYCNGYIVLLWSDLLLVGLWVHVALLRSAALKRAMQHKLYLLHYKVTFLK